MEGNGFIIENYVLKKYVGSGGEVIVPEGYCFYSYNGEPLPDFAAAVEAGHVFVRPKQ